MKKGKCKDDERRTTEDKSISNTSLAVMIDDDHDNNGNENDNNENDKRTDLSLLKSIMNGDDSPKVKRRKNSDPNLNHHDPTLLSLAKEKEEGRKKLVATQKQNEQILRAILEGEDSPFNSQTDSHSNDNDSGSDSDSDSATNKNDKLNLMPSSPSSSKQKRKRKQKQQTKRRNHNFNEYYTLLQKFKKKKHSLYLSASQIAAMIGMHPFTHLPKLCLALIYQGGIEIETELETEIETERQKGNVEISENVNVTHQRQHHYHRGIGTLLLKHDCKLLNIELNDIGADDNVDEALEIARKSKNKAIIQLYQESILLSRGIVPNDCGEQEQEQEHAFSNIESLNQMKNEFRETLQNNHESLKILLTPNEIKVLLDALNHNVNTGYGKFHEDDALDLYEKQCGWEVGERNSEKKYWKFQKAELSCGAVSASASASASASNSTNKSKSIEPTMTMVSTVVPIGRPESRKGRRRDGHRSGAAIEPVREQQHQKKKESTNQVVMTTSSSSSSSSPTVPPVATQNSGSSPTEAIEILHSSQEDENIDSKSKNNFTRNEVKNPNDKYCTSIGASTKITQHSNRERKPFFIITGIVDGVRDELYHVPSVPTIEDENDFCLPSYDQHPKHMELKYSDDDEWSLRKVIVECKHRVNRAFNPPPIYDQIQAVVYSFLYEVNESEIVQVVRSRNANGTMESVEGRRHEDNDSRLKHHSICTNNNRISSRVNSNSNDRSSDTTPSRVLNKVGRATDKALNVENIVQSLSSSSRPSQGRTTSLSTVNITSFRVSLDDPVMKHRQNWYSTVLPRLRSFVDAIYNIRSDDDKRYRFLRAAALALSHGGDESEWWQFLHDECPWMLHCDTAYSNKRYSYN